MEPNSVEQSTGTSIPVTWGIALKVWWAWFWKSMLISIGLGFVVGFVFGFLGAMAGLPQ